MEDLRATRTDSGVTIAWALQGLAGFRLEGIQVQRANEEPGPYQDLSESLLAPQHHMQFRDFEADPNRPQWYRLSLKFEAGGQELVGPVFAASITRRILNGLWLSPLLKKGGIVQIRYSLEHSNEHLSLGVYDVRGRRIKALQRTPQAAGEHLTSWDQRDESGQSVSRGLYFVRLKAGNFKTARKVFLH